MFGGCGIAQWLARWTVNVQSRVRFLPGDCWFPVRGALHSQDPAQVQELSFSAVGPSPAWRLGWILYYIICMIIIIIIIIKIKNNKNKFFSGARCTYFLDVMDVAENKIFKKRTSVGWKITRLKYFPNCFWDSVLYRTAPESVKQCNMYVKVQMSLLYTLGFPFIMKHHALNKVDRWELWYPWWTLLDSAWCRNRRCLTEDVRVRHYAENMGLHAIGLAWYRNRLKCRYHV